MRSVKCEECKCDLWNSAPLYHKAHTADSVLAVARRMQVQLMKKVLQGCMVHYKPKATSVPPHAGTTGKETKWCTQPNTHRRQMQCKNLHPIDEKVPNLGQAHLSLDQTLKTWRIYRAEDCLTTFTSYVRFLQIECH